MAGTLPRADPSEGRAVSPLFPAFPGCDIDSGLQTTLVFSDRNTRTISDRELRAISQANGARALQAAVDTYAAEITALADENRVDVLLAARPEQLTDTSAGTRELVARDHEERPPACRTPATSSCRSSPTSMTC